MNSDINFALTMFQKENSPSYGIQIETPYSERSLDDTMSVLGYPKLYGAHDMSQLIPYEPSNQEDAAAFGRSIQVIVAATYENRFYSVIVTNLDVVNSMFLPFYSTPRFIENEITFW